MAGYLPIYKPGEAITSKASAAITGGQLVAVSGANTVATSGANATNWVGMAAFDAAVNDSVTIFCGGVQYPIASGTVTAGDMVAAGAAGTVATAATPTTGQLVGVALSTATTGNRVRVAFIR